MQKCQFCGFLKPMFSLFRKACLLYKTSKIVFSRFIFTIYDMAIQGVTGGYNGLQGLTGGYKGLRGVTGGYKWWQGVTSGDKGWQGLARRYRGLQRIIQTFFYPERSQILFLGLFCIKIKVEQISNFWPKRWTNPFGKILILRVSYTVVFIVFKGFFFIENVSKHFFSFYFW